MRVISTVAQREKVHVREGRTSGNAHLLGGDTNEWLEKARNKGGPASRSQESRVGYLTRPDATRRSEMANTEQELLGWAAK